MKVGQRNRGDLSAIEKVGQRHKGGKMGQRYRPIVKARPNIMRRVAQMQ